MCIEVLVVLWQLSAYNCVCFGDSSSFLRLRVKFSSASAQDFGVRKILSNERRI